jgi:hypothetical protein
MSPLPVSSEPSALLESRPSPPHHPKVWAQALRRKRYVDKVGEEAEDTEKWGLVAEFLIWASGISLGASGVGLVQLRHREDLVVR